MKIYLTKIRLERHGKPKEINDMKKLEKFFSKTLFPDHFM